MRLWSLHPKHLDAKGLVALWREGLLAQKVLRGATRGYTRHPQLLRFEQHQDPLAAITAYLHAVCDEADRRGYSFSRDKLAPQTLAKNIPVTDGQLRFEEAHLRAKLQRRSPQDLHRLKGIEAHPLFTVIPGETEDWERP